MKRLATSSWVRYFRKPIWLGVTISNTVTWGLGFLLTARLGGVVYSATQAVLDSYGVSEARLLP